MEDVTERALGVASRSDTRIHTLYVVDERSYLAVPDDAREQVNHALERDGYDATRAIAEHVTETRGFGRPRRLRERLYDDLRPIA